MKIEEFGEYVFLPGGQHGERRNGTICRAHVPLAASQIAPAHAKTAYAVSVGTFGSLPPAERIRRVVLSKRYNVVIVRQGAASQVLTPPYRTRAQAERVGHGLEGCGIGEEIVTFRAP